MPVFATQLGQIYCGNALDFLQNQKSNSIDLIVTSPPFALLRKKGYGNETSENYLDWFMPFAEQFFRVLSPSGSLVIDIGGAWNHKQPTRSLYHLKLPIVLCEDVGFHLAQDYYWWNPSKLPTPAEWVTIRRIRVKDAINTVWWFSKTPWPKASNTRVLQPYSERMRQYMKNVNEPQKRPSGHLISDQFQKDNGGSIPPNLITIPNTDSNGAYLRYCKEKGIEPHPARFPPELPAYFIQMLTDRDDLVYDPFGGSCVTGEVAERLKRKWVCTELEQIYIDGAVGRFAVSHTGAVNPPKNVSYQLAKPLIRWNGTYDKPLDPGGGIMRS